MKKIFLFSLAIASLMLSSCNKEISTPSIEGQEVRVSASMGESKVYGSAKGRFYWQNNDKIGVWTGNEFTQFNIGAGWGDMTYAEFQGTIPAGGAISDNSIAFYPYNDEITFEGTKAVIPGYGGWACNYPTNQTYLYATAAPTEQDGVLKAFKFQHVTAYFRVTLKNIAVGCKALYLESWCPNAVGNNGQYMLNGGTIDVATGELTPNTCDWAFMPLPEHTSVISSLTIYIPVIPGTYGDSAKFRICGCKDASFGNEMPGCNCQAFITLNAQAGDFYVFPDITFPNEKSANDEGSGVNDGIEDPVVNEQDDNFWKIG